MQDQMTHAEAIGKIAELAEENERLKNALFFWLPNIPAIENECTERMANDAALLIGLKGRIDDSADLSRCPSWTQC